MTAKGMLLVEVLEQAKSSVSSRSSRLNLRSIERHAHQLRPVRDQPLFINLPGASPGLSMIHREIAFKSSRNPDIPIYLSIHLTLS